MKTYEERAEDYINSSQLRGVNYTPLHIKNAFIDGCYQHSMDTSLTRDEREIIQELRNVSDSFMRLPELDAGHAERTEFVTKIRELQSLVMQREAVRNNPGSFTIGKSEGLTTDWDDKENK